MFDVFCISVAEEEEKTEIKSEEMEISTRSKGKNIYKLVFDRLAKLCFYTGDALLSIVVQMWLFWFDLFILFNSLC